MHVTARSRKFATAGIAAALAFTVVLGGCASANQSSSGGTSKAASDKGLPTKLVAAAVAAAKKAAGGKSLGGTLSVLGINVGREQQILTAAMAPFTTATGTQIKYTGTEDQAQVLAAGVQSNNPPDIVDGQGLGLMVQYAKAGKAVALNNIISAKTLNHDYNKDLIDSTIINGKYYGVWAETDTFQVWYNTKTYTGPKTGSWSDLMNWAVASAAKDPKNAPFCMGLAAGAGSGFPGESWIESVFVQKYGPKLLTEWASGQLPWTSPQVKWAFQQFGRVATSKTLVQGGPQNAISTSIVDYSKGMFATPQTCQLTLWGNYAAGFAQGVYPTVKVPQDMDFFPIPATDPAYAGSIATNGHVTFAMKNTAATRAFMKYWETPAAQALIAASGEWTVGNKNVPLSAYPNSAMEESAKLLQNSANVVPGADATIPSAVDAAYSKGIITYLQDPSQLDAVLATIEASTK